MADAVHLAVAILAVAVGLFLRTIVPYLNKHAKDGSVTFDPKYALLAVVVFVSALFTAFTTIDTLPDLVQESLGATFLAYLLLTITTNHVVFEWSLDKGKG